VGRRPDTDFVFNVVWTQDVFHSLRYFVASQMAQSDARFRFIANACTPDALAAMHAFADRHADQVVEVLDLENTVMASHGMCLDRIFDNRDDGDLFCLIDTDIKARGPFVAEFAERLESCAAVTSGKGVWAETNVVPEGHPGVSGEYFYSRDGYVFGSPHLAVYQREPLAEVRQRWDISFANGGPDFSDEIQAQLERAGLDYWVYDTAKVTNILLQEDGHPLCHFEHPQILHIGGVSHYLGPPSWIEHDDGTRSPDWSAFPHMEARHEVARYTAATLQALIAEQPPPPPPTGLDPTMEERLLSVREEIVDLVETYRFY
jgi:hypothetical protein